MQMLPNLNSLPFRATRGTPQMLEFAVVEAAFLSKVNLSGVRNAMSVFAVSSPLPFHSSRESVCLTTQ